MSAVAGSLAELGSGIHDAQLKVIEYGPTGQQERFGLRWRTDLPAPGWVADPRVTVALRNTWIMDTRGVGGSATWGYLTAPETQRIVTCDGYFRVFGQSSYSWSPRAIRHADAAFAAGLTLQEKITACAWTWEPTEDAWITTVWYPKGLGDDISNVDIPDDHVGINIKLAQGRRIFKTTGWLNSAKQDATRPNLLPHLYSTKPIEGRLEYLLAQWRWVGIPD